MRTFPAILYLLCILVYGFLLNKSSAKLWDINYQNIDHVLQQNKLIVLLFYSSGCTACIKAVPEFRKSSDKFDQNPDVLFGMVDVMKDSIMSIRFNIRFVPIVNYFAFSKTKKLYSGILQEDAITKFFREVSVQILSDTKKEEIQRENKEEEDDDDEKNKEDQKKQWSHELELKDFEKVVLDKTKHVMLSLYTPECESECDMFEEAAYLFRNEDHIRFVRLNVVHSPKQIVDHFQVRRNPTLVWFSIRDKEYGTKQSDINSIASYISFLNHHAGTRRRIDGSLEKDAGRIPNVDRIIENNIHDIVNGINVDYVLDQCEKSGREFPGAPIFLKYYLTLLKELKKGTPLHDVLHGEQLYLSKKLKKKNSTIKNKEAWKKFTNIINFFVDTASNLLLDPKRKEDTLEKSKAFEEEMQQADKLVISATKIPHGHDEL